MTGNLTRGTHEVRPPTEPPSDEGHSPTIVVEPFGPSGLLLRLAPNRDPEWEPHRPTNLEVSLAPHRSHPAVTAADLLAAIDSLQLPGLRAHVGEAAVLVQFDPAVHSTTSLRELLQQIVVTPADARAATVTLTVEYDGEDLPAVAKVSGLSVQDVVDLHSRAIYRVAFNGFSPGFAYLSGLPTELRLPRRATPRTRVPAGSLAIAAHYCAIYPHASPGGWHLIGSCDAELFDHSRNPPALLQPGTHVRFEQATEESR